MSHMPPPPARPPSRLSVSSSSAVAGSGFDSSSELRGPLSTIPDSRQARFGSGRGEANSPSESSSTQPEGFSAVPWSAYFERTEDVPVASRKATFRVYFAGESGPVLFCIHGGGYTGLTWALIAARLKQSYRVVAMDMRAHGETQTATADDLSAEALTGDVIALWETLYGEEAPPTALLGHSVGGAIAVRAAATKRIRSLQGLVVIDVVEGTALAALPHMQAIIQHRPTSFPTLAAALSWAHHSGMTKSKEAAAVSLPSQLRKEVAVDRERWVWRTDLARSSPHWRGWYQGLSAAFLAVPEPKLLLLAGTDRLDRELTIGQMQGKFQMVLLPQAGHAVHEDESERTSEVLLGFLRRFRIGSETPGRPGES